MFRKVAFTLGEPDRLQRAQEEKRLEASHQRTRETCGPERLQANLSDNGIRLGIHRIKRIRKKLGLRCKQKRKFRVTMDSKSLLLLHRNTIQIR
jgi:putative transposase